MKQHMQDRKTLIGHYEIWYHTGKLITRELSLDEEVKEAQTASFVWMTDIDSSTGA